MTKIPIILTSLVLSLLIISLSLNQEVMAMTDSDGDGMSDENEIALGFDPNDPQSPFAKITYDTSFDWSMPDRYGLDENNDGLIDYFTTYESIHPEFWTVNFDACTLAEEDPTITSFEWVIEGQSFVKSTCDGFSYDFPNEGVFKVTLLTTNPQTVLSYTEKVTVQDWLIVSFGDSYASGEGVPDIPIPDDAFPTLNAIEQALNDARTLKLQLESDKNQILTDLAAAKSALDDAKKEYDDALNHLNDIKQKADNVKKYCDPLSSDFNLISCANALAELGMETFSIDTLNDIVGVAQSSFDVAEASYNFWSDSVDTLNARLAEINSSLTTLENKILEYETDLENFDTLAAKWQSQPDHRSANAGPAQAALMLEKMDPRTSVTFVHLAKSGATTEYLTPNPNPDHPDQIAKANELIGDREIDSVLLSIGGNDVKFADIMLLCIETQHCFNDSITPASLDEICSLFVPFDLLKDQCVFELSFVNTSKNAQTEFFENIYGNNPQGLCTSLGDSDCRRLLNLYSDLAQNQFPRLHGLASVTGDPRLDRIYQTEYVDATKDENGKYCDPQTNPNSPPFLALDENQWLDTVFETQLNQAIALAAEENGWNLADGIYDGFKVHGNCSTETWMTGIDDSLSIQKDISGTAHPNLKGHAFYGYSILNSMLSDLYDNNLPREPAASILETIDDIKSIGLPDGTENSLTKKISEASESLDKGNLKAAQNQLESLLNELNAQKGKKVSSDNVEDLSKKIQFLIDDIESQKQNTNS